MNGTDTTAPPPDAGSAPPTGGMPFGLDPQTIQALQQRANQMLQSQVQSPWQQAFGRWATSPVTGALMGAASGFGQAAMPTPYRMPFGAVLGMGMQGMQTGMQNAYRSQQEQAQAQNAQLQSAVQMAQMPGTMARAQALGRLYSDPNLLTSLRQTAMGGGVGVTPPTMPQGPQPKPATLAPFVGSNLPQGVTPDEDQMVRTVYGEAGGEPLAGQQAVAAVIRNRMKGSGQSTQDVIFSPNQFEPWNNPAARAKLESLDPNSQAYQDILTKAVRPIMSGTAQDPTGGATYFFNPTLQAQLGRSVPAFAQGNQTTIGNHQFYYGPYGGSTAPTRNDTSQPLYLGDSLTSKGGIGGQTGQGKVGANPDAVLAQIGNTNVNGRDVVLSSGVSNNPADVAKVEAQLQALQKNGAKSVTLVGAAPQFGLDSQMQQIAARNGARFVPLDPNQISEDKIHPTTAGYLALTNQTRPQAGTQYAGPGVPQPQPGVTPPTVGGGLPNADQAWQQVQRLNAQAGAIESLKAIDPMLAIGLPDPNAIRAQAQELYKSLLAPGTERAKAEATAPIDVEKARQIALNNLPIEMAKLGFQKNADGTYNFIPGLAADPAYKGAVAASEAAARVPAAIATEAGKSGVSNITIRGQGAWLFDPTTGQRTWKGEQTPTTLIGSDGSEYRATQTVPEPGSGKKAEVQLMTDNSGAPVVAKASPTLEAFRKQYGDDLAKQFSSAQAEAAAAKEGNYQFDNMRTSIGKFAGWTPDMFAPARNEANQMFLALGHSLGLSDEQMPELNKGSANYVDFGKNAGQVLRTAVKGTGSRVGVQEYRLIGETLPSHATPEQTFLQLADQYQGLNDYHIAKEQFMRSYASHPQDFQADWDAKISPTAFMINRMAQTPEGQQRYNELIQRLVDSGHAADAQSMIHEYATAKGLHLFDELPGGQR